MKNFKLSLLSLTLISGSASAYTLYDTLDSQEYGTQVDFTGSARLQWSKTSEKETDVRNGTTRRNTYSNPVRNNGSRFGFKLTQELGNDFYGIGRVEWRFRGRDNAGVRPDSQHGFTHLYTRQLYAGVGHKKYGELTYGNQTVITDEVKQTDLPNTLSLSDGLLVSGARRSVQYVYQGVKGLKVGGFYGGESPRENNGLALDDHRLDTYGAAAIYTHEIDKDQEFVIATGATRERYRQSGRERDSVTRATLYRYPSTYSSNAYALDMAYTYDKTTFGLDLERRITKGEESMDKQTEEQIRTVIYHKMTSEWRVYGMYARKTDKHDYVSASANSDRKYKTNEFMFGTEYRFAPTFAPFLKNIRGFVEWKTERTKQYRSSGLRTKERNNTTVVGLRAYW